MMIKKAAIYISEIYHRSIDRWTKVHRFFFSMDISEHVQNTAGVGEANIPPVCDWWSPADFDMKKIKIISSIESIGDTLCLMRID